MKKQFLFGFIFVPALLVTLVVQANTKIQNVKPDQISIMGPENCRTPKGIEKKWFPANWSVYVQYAKICPLTSKGKTILSILTTDYQQYFNDKKKNPEAVEKPLIVGSKGEKLGELSESFFADGPTWLQLVFWSWEDNFPQRIVPLRHSISVTPSEALNEIYWDPSEKLFKLSTH